VTLVEFLLARNDELGENADRIHLLGCGEYVWTASLPCDCGQPARVLAECQARRAIIELHRYGHECSGFYDNGQRINPSVGWASDPDPCDTLRFLVQPFKDHPDFDAAWLQD
jgi:hypothetical protein